MGKDFQQNDWGPALQWDLQRLLEIAVSEDVETIGDLTSLILIPESARGKALIHLREPGVVAGVNAVETVLHAVEKHLDWEPSTVDGMFLDKGALVGTLLGPARSLLTAERLVLNLLGRLSGIATLTKRYVDAVSGTSASIYDTRKTTLGWRRLEKYAVRCGGGRNHRAGLFDAVLIKDNHLAFGLAEQGFTPAGAVARVKEYFLMKKKAQTEPVAKGAERCCRFQMQSQDSPIIEVEVDTLEQLREVLTTDPDLVLLDNMRPGLLTQAVQIRQSLNPRVQLEASGGITLETVRAVAETGVERISVGALTHSAISLDLGLDWK